MFARVDDKREGLVGGRRRRVGQGEREGGEPLQYYMMPTRPALSLSILYYFTPKSSIRAEYGSPENPAPSSRRRRLRGARLRRRVRYV